MADDNLPVSISAFGPFAEEYARGLGDLDAIVTEVATLVPAVREAMLRRGRGERFYGMVLLDHPGPMLTRLNANQALANVTDYDVQLLVLDQLALGVAMTPDGRAVREFWTIEPEAVKLMEDFYGLADAMLVRSYGEFVRLSEISGRFARSVERVLVEPVLPAVERVRPRRPGVVVWAPRRPTLEVTLHALGLREFIGDVTCVTAGGPQPSQPHATFVEVGDPRIAQALASAACVVCVEPDDPGDAVAFARRGYGVVAPLTAGAHELAADVVSWNGTPSTLQHCVAMALARPASARAPGDPIPPTPQAPPPPAWSGAMPLVSVVCPTYNRPRDLRSLLECVAAQTYPNLEVVVVNDGGMPVSDVVADFPFAQLIDSPVNRGAHAAVSIGVRAARGVFVDMISDDDLFYPDHFERLVYALLRSGAKVAHGAGLWRQVEREPDDSFRTLRVNCSHLRGTITPSEALLNSPMCFHQVLWHRKVFDQVGEMRADVSGFCDQEMLLRIAQGYTFVYVDHVTSEFRDYSGSLGKTTNAILMQRRVYDELHPRPERPEIQRKRERILAGFAEQFVPWNP